MRGRMQNFEGDWTNSPSLTLKQTNRIPAGANGDLCRMPRPCGQPKCALRCLTELFTSSWDGGEPILSSDNPPLPLPRCPSLLFFKCESASGSDKAAAAAASTLISFAAAIVSSPQQRRLPGILWFFGAASIRRLSLTSLHQLHLSRISRLFICK